MWKFKPILLGRGGKGRETMSRLRWSRERERSAVSVGKQGGERKNTGISGLQA